jgi:hypothetical protein
LERKSIADLWQKPKATQYVNPKSWKRELLTMQEFWGIQQIKDIPKIPERKKINTPQKRMRPINENNIFLLKHLQQAQQINPRLRLGI